MDNQDREKDLARAKAAMGGADHEKRKQEQSLEWEKRRLEASVTMESSEHKEKRPKIPFRFVLFAKIEKAPELNRHLDDREGKEGNA